MLSVLPPRRKLKSPDEVKKFFCYYVMIVRNITDIVCPVLAALSDQGIELAFKFVTASKLLNCETSIDTTLPIF